MKKSLVIIALFTLSNQAQAGGEGELSGIPKLACEAILCLSTGSPPGECSPSLNHYFNINYRSFSRTIRERANFLKQCPVAEADPQMVALVNAISNGAGRCDADSLNATLISYPRGFSGGGCVSDVKPSYCNAYEQHDYTELGQTVYQPAPPRTSYWPFSSISSFTGIGMGTIAGIGRTPTESCGRWVTLPATE